MPNQPKTPQRAIRIPDDLWQAALARAQAEGTNISAEINRFLKRYIRRPLKTPTTGED